MKITETKKLYDYPMALKVGDWFKIGKCDHLCVCVSNSNGCRVFDFIANCEYVIELDTKIHIIPNDEIEIVIGKNVREGEAPREEKEVEE